MKRVLLAEDNPTSASFLRMHLEKAGYYVITAYNGARALEYWKKDDYDVVITDWMMPIVDGVEMLRYIRGSNRKQPFVIIYTALNSESARKYSLECGANEFFAKPIEPSVLIASIEKQFSNTSEQIHQTQPAVRRVPATGSKNFKSSKAPDGGHISVTQRQVLPPFIGICLALSTGGPITLTDMLTKLPRLDNAAVFIVLHGPSWMMDSFAQRLTNVTGHTVLLAEHGMQAKPGIMYLAAGDHHMQVNNNYTIELNQEPKENYVRPAADPLFRTCAFAFGKYCVGVVMTGLGSDGTKGSEEIHNHKGSIIIQDPLSCIAPPMPNSVLKAGIPCTKIHIDNLHSSIEQTYKLLLVDLQRTTSAISGKLQRA